MATVTLPATFEDRVRGVGAFASRAVWRAGWGGSIRTTPTIDGDRATVNYELLDDTTPDPPERVDDEVRARFVAGVKLAATTMGLVLVEIGDTSFTLRARTQEDQDREYAVRKIVERAKLDARHEATPLPAGNVKLRAMRAPEESLRDWTKASHAEQCAGIAEALACLRISQDPNIGSVSWSALAAGAVARIARSSPRPDVRVKAALRLRELGRVQEAEQLGEKPTTRKSTP